MTERSRWQLSADRLTEARSRAEIGDAEWFAGMAAIFDEAYLQGENPRAQSGFGGDESRWEIARRPVATVVDKPGSFLDVGCANGYLLECLARWTDDRIDPYGLDFAPKVVQLARSRLPRWAHRIYLGNALTWEPPCRFDYVRTELVYVPDDLQQRLTERLLNHVVAPGGCLIVCGYGSPRSNLPVHPVRQVVRTFGFAPETEFVVEAPEGSGAIAEIAVVRA